MSDMNLLRLPQLRQKIRMGRTTIYNKVKAGEFPAPVELPGSRIAWREDEIDAWISNRPRREATRTVGCATNKGSANSTTAVAVTPIIHSPAKKIRAKKVQTAPCESARKTRPQRQGLLFE